MADERISDLPPTQQTLAQLFAAQIFDAERHVHAADESARQLGSTDNAWRTYAGESDWAQSALSYASGATAAAANGFLALKLLTLGSSAPGMNRESLSVNLTVNGTAAVLRQSIECSARAIWFLAGADHSAMEQRGFFGLWSDASEFKAYAYAIGSGAREEAKGKYEELRVEGLNRGWLVADEVTKKIGPVIRCDVSSVLRSVPFPRDTVAGLDVTLGSYVGRSEWTYRWLSALVHGYSWPFPAPEQIGAGRVVQRMPSLSRLLLCAVMARTTLLQAIDTVTVGPQPRTH